MFISAAQFGRTHISFRSLVRALPCEAMKGYLRRAVAPTHVVLQRLPACVAAKQNGFWQIVR